VNGERNPNGVRTSIPWKRVCAHLPVWGEQLVRDLHREVRDAYKEIEYLRVEIGKADQRLIEAQIMSQPADNLRLPVLQQVKDSDGGQLPDKGVDLSTLLELEKGEHVKRTPSCESAKRARWSLTARGELTLLRELTIQKVRERHDS